LAANFKGLEFIFDGKTSDSYGLKIYNNGTGSSDGNAGDEIEVFEKFIYRNSKAIYFGRTQNTPLEFDLLVGSLTEIDNFQRRAIKRWLMGRSGYLPLCIVQDDMSNVIYYVMVTSMKETFYGNLNYALELHIKANGPFAYTSPQITPYSYSGSAVTSTTLYYDNISDDSDYLKPILSFKMNGIGTNFSITNVTDANRVFSFTDILPYETITVDNYKEEIVSDTGLTNRVSKFNKKFFRLKPGINQLNIVGGISNLTITSEFPIKVGG
jgi:phage-related protein